MSDPYRTTAMMAPRSGLFRANRPNPHSCHPPGWWVRQWYWLTGRSIHIGSLYRCPDCQQVWRATMVDDGYGGSFEWVESTESEWTRQFQQQP